jgi:GNAT superfamily N-acetyltransferase
MQTSKNTIGSSVEINIRAIQNNELPIFKDLLKLFYEEIAFDFHTPNLDNIIADFLTKGNIMIAVANDNIVGFISFIESTAIYAKGSFGVVNELYIIPEFRSKKVGQKLMEYVVAFGKTQHWERIELDTPEPEGAAKALNFYKKEGFTTSGYRMKKTLVKI